jgi:hypothetical protein
VVSCTVATELASRMKGLLRAFLFSISLPRMSFILTIFHSGDRCSHPIFGYSILGPSGLWVASILKVLAIEARLAGRDLETGYNICSVQ